MMCHGLITEVGRLQLLESLLDALEWLGSGGACHSMAWTDGACEWHLTLQLGGLGG